MKCRRSPSLGNEGEQESKSHCIAIHQRHKNSNGLRLRVQSDIMSVML
jgi:hypothetical protein